MSSTDFGSFTLAERRAALVQLTRDVIRAGVPKTYPPNKDGHAKDVKPGSQAFAAACWAKRRLDAIEFSIKPDDNAPSSEPSSQGSSDADTPF